MTEYISQTVDIAVIGAGHAGIEAALAAARSRQYALQPLYRRHGQRPFGL